MELKKLINNEAVAYIFVGGCTTFLNMAIYFVLTNWFNINYLVSNCIAWIFAVTFAFFANKFIVFKSRSISLDELIVQMCSFFGLRLVSLIFDMALMFVLISIMGNDKNIMKIVVTILVIILDYLFSKFIVFKKKNV